MKNRNFVKKLNKNAESLAVVHTHTHTHTCNFIRDAKAFINHIKKDILTYVRYLFVF